ncbi:MAG: glycosyltransferase [Candidatus Omnitrophica bacterium]|nr:glycosyltransferase [Candidatus Omnitrophota bacterium]
MKVSGFTIVRNAQKYHYPVVASITSILDICDEFVVNIGDSQDGTKALVQSIKSDKIRIIEHRWDMSLKEKVLSEQTNVALEACQGDWAFYLQSDEVVHEKDLGPLARMMEENLHHPDVDALRFRWLHFYGSYYRYRIDEGWYQKQDRIIRNNRSIESYGDAFGFRCKNRQPLRRLKTPAYIYHYGWVHSPDIMTRRRCNAEQVGFTTLQEQERTTDFDYGELKRFPAYFGTHPKVMQENIHAHAISQQDRRQIRWQYWWHPMHWTRSRYKTGRRIRTRIT